MIKLQKKWIGNKMRIYDIINETTSGSIAAVAMPFKKKNKKTENTKKNLIIKRIPTNDSKS
jgi:hypothetical protein